MPPSLELLQGTLDVLILKALEPGPTHGYAVARWIRERSDTALQVEDRALYVALHRMEDRGWIDATWGVSENNRRAKYYRLTGAGRRAARKEAAKWAAYAAAMDKVLDASAEA